MTTWFKVRGDVKDTITVILNGVEDLDNVQSVEGHVWLGATKHNLDAEVTDSTTRTVVVQLGGAEGWLSTAARGAWKYETEVTFADGTILTWPAEQPDVIQVRNQGD